MQTTTENGGVFFDLVAESYELTLRLSNGDFDAEPDTKRQVVEFLEVARPFCDEYLSAWPESNATLP